MKLSQSVEWDFGRTLRNCRVLPKCKFVSMKEIVTIKVYKETRQKIKEISVKTGKTNQAVVDQMADEKKKKLKIK